MSKRKQIELPGTITTGQLLNWGNRFDNCLLLDSNSSKTGQIDPLSNFDFCLAAGSVSHFSTTSCCFEKLHAYHSACLDWIFGHLSYDLKNDTAKLHSSHPDRIGFPLIHFFQPRYLITSKDGQSILHFLPEHDDATTVSAVVQKISTTTEPQPINSTTVKLQQQVREANYLETVQRFLQHIQLGDIYEANYCMEFYHENALIDPPGLYSKLNEISPMPYSAYYRLNGLYLMCASPERFLAKRGEKLVSQPIKGTIRRGVDKEEDHTLATQLQNDIKELAENVMITDLVRNDLSITAARGSVVVEELAGLKTFPKIHQLVTTISSRLDCAYTWADALRYAFPMGSMTGAPKLRAMEIIEDLEVTKRGLYSGSVGYITPEGDFDFNVVIRSIQYNQSSAYLSIMAGSALTSGCSPESEYQECLLKTATMRKSLE